MTNDDVSKFRGILEATVVELERSMRRRDGILIETCGDEFDRMHGENERDLAVQTLHAVANQRRAALAALQRIQEGAFGVCVECEEAINPRRLAALPAAALCIRCQEAVDCRCGAKSEQLLLAMAA